MCYITTILLATIVLYTLGSREKYDITYNAYYNYHNIQRCYTKHSNFFVAVGLEIGFE